MKIIYKNEYDTAEFDKQRYLESLKRYGEVDEEEFEKMVKEKLEPFAIRHYSVLVKEAIPLFSEEDAARNYYDDHHEGDVGIERLRRITGYLVGTIDRWNDGKKAEERERVKHNVDGVYTKAEKSDREIEKQAHISDNQDEYHKITVS